MNSRVFMGNAVDFDGCPASDKTLALPEIRNLISHYITKRRDVLSCMLVNSAWHQTFSTAPLWHTTTYHCSHSAKRNPPLHQFLEHSVHVRHLVISDFFAIPSDLILLLQAYTTARAGDCIDRIACRASDDGINSSHAMHRLVSLSIDRQLLSDFQYFKEPGARLPQFQQLLAALVRCNSATLKRIQLKQIVTVPLGREFWLAVAHLPHLKQLHLDQCGITKECADAFMLGCNSPLDLHLSGMMEIRAYRAPGAPEDDHEVIQDLLRLPSNMRRMKLTAFKSLTPELQLQRIIARHRGLQQLDWRLLEKKDSKRYAEALRRFLVWERGLPELEGLNFPYSEWSEDDLVTIIQALSRPLTTSSASFGRLSLEEGTLPRATCREESFDSTVSSTACHGNITLFGVRGSGFGLRALAALEPHFRSLTCLDLRDCPAVSSPMLQFVLEIAEKLQRFQGDMISRTDILNGYEWVCTGLTHWRCYIDMGPTPDHGGIFQRLARLKSLKTFDLSQRCEEKKFKHGCTLDLRLHMGLGHLAQLKCMQVLKFEGTMQAMGRDEIRWMKQHWPHLRKMVGRHNFEP
ncbi:hypothetical protein BGZ72_009072 [Mortierella alpina]|nr:hypothetical protein BGZ72_009072 [Mortierella alpina]